MCQLMKNVNVSLRIISDSIIIALKNNTTIISSIAKLGGGGGFMDELWFLFAKCAETENQCSKFVQSSFLRSLLKCTEHMFSKLCDSSKSCSTSRTATTITTTAKSMPILICILISIWKVFNLNEITANKSSSGCVCASWFRNFLFDCISHTES